MKIEQHQQVVGRLAELEREFGQAKDPLDHKMYEREVARIDLSAYREAKARYVQWDKKEGRSVSKDCTIHSAELCKVLHGDRGQALNTEYRVKVYGTVPTKTSAKSVDKDKNQLRRNVDALLPVDGFVSNGQPSKYHFEIVPDEIAKDKKADK